MCYFSLVYVSLLLVDCSASAASVSTFTWRTNSIAFAVQLLSGRQMQGVLSHSHSKRAT